MRGWARRVGPVVVAAAFVWLALGSHSVAGASGTTTTTTAPLTTTTTSTLPAGVTRDLGGLNVALYCEDVTGSGEELLKGSLGTDAAYDNWACDSNNAPLDMTTLCQWTYQSANVGDTIVASATDPNDAESWLCYANGAPTSPGNTVPYVTVPGGSAGGYVSLPGRPAPIAGSLGTPGEVFHSPQRDIINALIAVGVILLIAFPANIFNQTLSDNYDEILGLIDRVRRRIRQLIGLDRASHGAGADHTVATPSAAPTENVDEAVPTPGKTTVVWFLATLAVGALLGGALDPSFGLNGSSLEDLVGTFCAFGCGAALSCYVGLRFRRRHGYVVVPYLRALPLGLLVALAGVVISRVTDFQPGYLYGVVVSVSFAGSLPDHHNGRLIAFSTLATLSVGLTSWLLWIPVNHLATGSSNDVVLTVLDDVLGSIFVGSLFGTVINLLPLHELPGGHLTRWRREVWGGVMFVAVFLLVAVELHPASGPTHPGGAAIATVAILFVGFGSLSLGLREYFRRRHHEVTAAPISVLSEEPGEEPA